MARRPGPGYCGAAGSGESTRTGDQQVGGRLPAAPRAAATTRTTALIHGRNCGAPHCPSGSSLDSAHQRADDEKNRPENCLAQAPPRGPKSVQARADAEANALTYDEKHLRQYQRIC